MFRLPSPFGVEQIRAAIFRAAKALVHEWTVLGLIQRIRIIPNPIPIKQITTISFFRKKLNLPIQTQISISQPNKSLWSKRKYKPFWSSSIIQEKEATNQTNRHKKEPQNPKRRLEQSQTLQFITNFTKRHGFKINHRRGLRHWRSLNQDQNPTPSFRFGRNWKIPTSKQGMRGNNHKIQFVGLSALLGRSV